MSDFENTNLVVNGYFYSFKYYPIKAKTEYDKEPFILCFGPEKLDRIIGINLHLLELDLRVKFLLELAEIKDISKEDFRLDVITEDKIKSTFYYVIPALRYYSRKGMKEIVRVKTNCVGKYIESNGNIFGAKSSDIMEKYWGTEYGKVSIADPKLNIKGE